MDEEAVGMNDADGLKVSLCCLKLQSGETALELNKVTAEFANLDRKLDSLHDRADAILKQLEIEHRPPSPPELTVLPAVSDLRILARSQTWSARVEQFRTELTRRGIDADAIAWEDVLGAPACQQVRKRFSVDFRLEADLDCYDVWMIAIAALTGVLVDWLLVNVPPGARLLGRKARQGGVFTRWLKSVEVPDDNWLAKRFKTAYDGGIPGVDHGSHRLRSFGHDPFIGLVVGVFDIMRGGMTHIDKAGVIRTDSGSAEAVTNPFAAVIYHLGHILSDAFTPRGLPPPGWGLLLKLQAVPTPFGDRSIAEIAKIMYRDGYDSRHFLAMGTVPAAIESVLYAYFALRCHCDSEFKDALDRQIELAAGKRRADSEKYLTMSLLANASTAALNGIRVCVQGPLGFNYPQWLNFTRRLLKWLTRRLKEPSDILLRGIEANSRALLNNWPIPKFDSELAAIASALREAKDD
jgi:hypothetical protein